MRFWRPNAAQRALLALAIERARAALPPEPAEPVEPRTELQFGMGATRPTKRRLYLDETCCWANRSYGRGLCQSRAIFPNGRCRLHGGCSTGPRTAQGKARALAALSAINASRVAR